MRLSSQEAVRDRRIEAPENLVHRFPSNLHPSIQLREIQCSTASNAWMIMNVTYRTLACQDDFVIVM